MRATGTGSYEIVSAFAKPFPLTIIGTQLGASETDVALLERWIDRIGLAQSEAEERASVATEIEAQHYFRTIMDGLRGHPDGSALSDLVNTPMSDGTTVTDSEIFGHLWADMFVGGSETTANALASGMILPYSLCHR